MSPDDGAVFGDAGQRLRFRHSSWRSTGSGC